MDFLDDIAALGAVDRPPAVVRETKRNGLFYGSALVNGVLQFFSVSSLSLGDPQSKGGCQRRWWYEKIAKLGKTDQGHANVLGTALHDENATYLETGDRSVLGPLALAGLHTLQPPGPDLHVEYEIASRDPATKELRSALTCCGLPVVGKIDLWHRRGTCAGASEILDTVDPEGTTEVQDHKTTSKLEYALPSTELPDTVQMSGYGTWAHNDHGADPVRLSHGYYITTGRPRAEKRTILVPAERLLRRWEYVEGVGRILVDITRETDANRVPFNAHACDFPRRKKADIERGIPDGCPYQNVCDGARQHRLHLIYGAPKQGEDMSFLDSLDDTPASTEDVGLRSALAEIAELGGALGLGFPALGGPVAREQAALRSIAIEGDGLAGSGRLGAKLMIATREDALKLASDLRDAKAKAAPEPKVAPVTSVDDKAAPAQPGDPVAGHVVDTRPAPELVPPGAPAPGTAPPPEPKAPKPPKAERKPKADKPAPTDAAQPYRDAINDIARAAAEGEAKRDATLAAQPRFPGVLILIDARPEFTATNLRPLVQAWADKAAKSISVLDIRSNAVPRESAYAFGGWRGAFYAIARVELAALPPDVYFLDTRDGDFAQIAADAALSTPGLAVARGVR